MMITPEQIRAARALLRLEQGDLASRAGVSVITIRRMEDAGRPPRVAPATIDTVRRALEDAGAEFITDGVRRRRPSTETSRLFDDLRAISLRSAERLHGREVLTDEDLYDEDGLPA